MNQGRELNHTVDNIQDPGSDQIIRGYANGGVAGSNGKRKTGNPNAYSRGPSSTNHQVDHDEP